MVEFLDYGMRRQLLRSDIHYISRELISRLPFQAIECRSVSGEGRGRE